MWKIVFIPLVLILASGGVTVRNLHTHWGSWEPLRRTLKPNALRPIVYLPRHHMHGVRRNADRVSADELLLRLFHERAWDSAVNTIKRTVQLHRDMLDMGIVIN